MLEILLRIIKQEGVFALFKGFAANMINTFSMRALSMCTEQSSSSRIRLFLLPHTHQNSSSQTLSCLFQTKQIPVNTNRAHTRSTSRSASSNLHHPSSSHCNTSATVFFLCYPIPVINRQGHCQRGRSHSAMDRFETRFSSYSQPCDHLWRL